MWFLPSRSQWAKWSLPSKLTAIGAYVGIFGIVLSLVLFAVSVYMQGLSSALPEPADPRSRPATDDGPVTRRDVAQPSAGTSATQVLDANKARNSSHLDDGTTPGILNGRKLKGEHNAPTDSQRSFEFPRDMPVWNLPTDTPLIRFATNASPPDCRSCWSPAVTIDPGQTLYAALRYGNYGGVTARRAWLKLRIPRDFRDGPAVMAMLGASNASTVYGAACIEAKRGPLVLLPDVAGWYAQGSDKPLPLPFKQSANTILQRAVQLGDVAPGAAYASDIVFRFHAVPITFVAIRATEGWINSIESAFDTADGDIDLITAVKSMFDDRTPFVPGEVDIGDDLAPRGWVSPLVDIAAGDALMVYVFGSNPSNDALHAAALRLVPERDNQQQTLRIDLIGRETTYTIARTKLASARKLDVVGAFRLSAEGLGVGVGVKSAAELSKVKIRSADIARMEIVADLTKSIPLGDVPGDAMFAVMLLIEVQ